MRLAAGICPDPLGELYPLAVIRGRGGKEKEKENVGNREGQEGREGREGVGREG